MYKSNRFLVTKKTDLTTLVQFDKFVTSYNVVSEMAGLYKKGVRPVDIIQEVALRKKRTDNTTTHQSSISQI